MTKKYCEICKTEVMSKNFSRHINSKKHAKKLEVQKGGEEVRGDLEVQKGGMEVQKGGEEVQKGGKEVRGNLEVQKGGKEVKSVKLFTKRKEKIGADIRDSSTKLLPNPSWQKYSGEKHLKNYNYAGPGTRLDLRLDENKNPKPGEEPINKIDEACLKHDIAYESESIKDRHVADVELIHDLNAIKNLTWNEKLARILIKNIMKAKVVFGGSYNLRNKNIDLEVYRDSNKLGEIKGQENFPLEKSKQLKLKNDYKIENDVMTNELHHEYRKPKKWLKVHTKEKDDTWSADLVFIPFKDQGYKILLTVIDLHTRYAWVVPLKDKQGSSIKDAFENIFEEFQRIPKKLWVDNGTEFYNKIFKSFCEENEITIYSTYNEGKAVVIERFNRTFKTWMWKEFTKQGNQKWLHLIKPLLEKYNNKIHSSTGISPIDCSMRSNKSEDINAKDFKKIHKKKKFEIGDYVRIYKKKKHFEKGYTHKWTNEIFIVDKIFYDDPRSGNLVDPITYGIRDLNNEEILGRFYTEELQKTSFPIN